MSNLSNKTQAESYDQLLITTGDSGIPGSGTNTTRITTGAADDRTNLYLSTDRIGIGDDAPNQILGIKGTNAQVVIEEDDTAFLRLGVGESDGTAVIGYDDGDKLQMGVYSSPTDTSIAPYVTIDSAGNVGIGTIVPAYELTLSASDGPTLGLWTTNSDITNSNVIGEILFLGNEGGTAFSGAAIKAVATSVWGGHVNDCPTELQFWTTDDGNSNATAQRMVIDRDGNVGIGTSSPQEELQIQKDDGFVSLSLNYHKSSGAIGNATSLAGIFFGGVDDNIDGYSSASIKVLADGTWDSDTKGTMMKFATHTDGTSSENTNALVIDKNARVGIGTATPMNNFQVDNGGVDGSNGVLIVNNEGSVDNNDVLGGIGFDSTDGNVPSSIFQASAYIAAYAKGSHSSTSKGGHLAFGVAIDGKDQDVTSTERMRIQEDGNVGIGITAPARLLHMSDAAPRFMITDTSTGADFEINCDSGVGAATILADANNEGSAPFLSIGVTSESMRIIDGGNVGIGATAPDAKLEIGSVSNGVALHVSHSENSLENADVCLELEFDANEDNDSDGRFLDCRTVGSSAREQRLFINSMGEVLNISGNDIAPISSDERMKTNIKDYTGGLAIVNSLKPRTFEWKEGRGDEGLKYGFISQEIQAINGIKKEMNLYRTYNIPSDDKNIDLCTDGIMNTTQLSAKECILISAIKELSAKVEALENK